MTDSKKEWGSLEPFRPIIPCCMNNHITKYRRTKLKADKAANQVNEDGPSHFLQSKNLF